MQEIYIEGTKRIIRDLSLEKLLIELREIKVFMKTQGYLNDQSRYDL